MRKTNFIKDLSVGGIFIGVGASLFLSLQKDRLPATALLNTKGTAMVTEVMGGVFTDTPQVLPVDKPRAKHILTPQAVKAIYMTSWVASTRDWRTNLTDFARRSEINSIVIDVKDYSGFITFDTGDPEIKAIGSEDIRDKDLQEFIGTLHESGIYVIARITVFQDPVYSKKYPTQAVQRTSGAIWKDRKGLSYVDPSSAEYRKYLVRIAQASERIGFDELNFDYVRFPSDGNMSDIVFPLSGKKSKPEVLESFWYDHDQYG